MTRIARLAAALLTLLVMAFGPMSALSARDGEPSTDWVELKGGCATRI
jgi:hypothetical protein